ncbi:MAG: efflux RND transporter periplasmic adaptor subunit [Pseudomonadales bacterium]|nr:efflux RND transporter periplasmic adaptor subunit [Pseudomonadales bacterium]MBL6815419.1 efflux RND transporter periplasmic adaptor subunit [Pseudomonadales bacterium]
MDKTTGKMPRVLRVILWVLLPLTLWGPQALAELTVSYIHVTPQAAYSTTRVYAGISRASRRSDLGFERGGEVALVNVDLGDRVEAGEILARLDTRALQSSLRQTQADAALAIANQNATRAQTELAANTERRLRALRAKGHISQQAFDEARLEYQASKAQLAVAFAAVERAQAMVETMQVALTQASIEAPYDGVIQARHVDEGSQIGSGLPALTLVEMGQSEAHIGIPEGAVATLEIDQAYEIRWQTVAAKGRLRTVLPEVDPSTRTATAIFSIQDQSIPLGAVVELTLRESVIGNGFWVPIDALTAMDRGLWGLYIVDNENTIQRRLIEIVHNEGDRAFVRGLLSPGDRVVATGTQRIVPGQRVIPAPARFTISAR